MPRGKLGKMFQLAEIADKMQTISGMWLVMAGISVIGVSIARLHRYAAWGMLIVSFPRLTQLTCLPVRAIRVSIGARTR